MKRLDLKKMVGPLPVGAWLIVVAVGVGLAYMARRQSMLAGPVADAPATDSTVEPGYPTTSGVGTVPLGSSSMPTSSGPTTNAEWVSYATRTLVGLGRPQGAFAISQALTKYVSPSTSSLTPAERTIVEDALRYAGLPPEGVGTISVGGSPASTPPSTPAYTLHWTVVRPGETPNMIASRLRAAGARTADGRALTAAYLIRMNQWGPETAATAAKKRWPGEPVKY